MSNSRQPDVDRLATMLKALAHPQRLRVFMRLTRCCEPDGCCGLGVGGLRHCVGELAGDLDLAASTVSHHLKELRVAGVMNTERRGQRVECWVSGEALSLLADFFAEAREAARAGVPVMCERDGGRDGT